MITVEGCRRRPALWRLFHLRQQEQAAISEINIFLKTSNANGSSQDGETMLPREKAQQRREAFIIFQKQKRPEIQIKRGILHALNGRITSEERDYVLRHMNNFRFVNVIPGRSPQRV